MACPDNVTIDNLTGVWDLNKTLGDNSSNMLKMQNVGFIVRQAIAYSAVEITLKQYTDDAGVVHLHSVQVSTGNQRNEEEWHLDDAEHEVQNRIWGQVKGLAQMGRRTEKFRLQYGFATLADLPDDDYLKQDWDSDKFIVSDIKSATDTWTAYQVLGFAVVDGKRRHVRRVVGRKGDKVERIRLIYDWKYAA
nr:hypothetical protein CFP56_50485 [Quercus suber]